MHLLVAAIGVYFLRFAGRHGVILGAVRQQHRAIYRPNGVNGGNVVETLADYALNVEKNVGAERPVRNPLQRKPAPHDAGRMREGSQTYCGSQIVPSGSQ